MTTEAAELGSRKIGLFGGGFDPPHIGHFIIAMNAVETLGLDELRWVPLAHAPHKGGSPPLAPGDLRIEMIEEGLGGISGHTVSPVEIERGGISYTMDTVERFRKADGPSASYYLLMGEDSLAILSSWHRVDELLEVVSIVSYPRLVSNSRQMDDCRAWPLEDAGNHIRLEGPCIGISSTMVRNRIAAGLSVKYIVPDPVVRIIEDAALYR